MCSRVYVSVTCVQLYLRARTHTHTHTRSFMSRVMLHLIYMANHSFSNNARVTSAQDSAVQLLAARDLAAHELVLLNYGDLSNDLFLLDYGFLMGRRFQKCQFTIDDRYHIHGPRTRAPPNMTILTLSVGLRVSDG